jgi:hypothetical protein
VLLSLLGVAFTASAQSSEAPAAVVSYAPAPVPFGLGEKLGFKITLGPFGEVGHGSMEVAELDTVNGHPAYDLRFAIKGGVAFARVDDKMESWLDVRHLVSRRFHQDQKEIRYQRHRKFDFFPEEKRWSRTDKDETGELATDRPLDDVSFLYYVRTLPLEIGKTYELNRYFQANGNPVVVKVLRKEKVTVPAGTFMTIVVQPVIQTKGLFGKGGRAEVYFTDDERRLVVQLKSSVPVLGSLNMYLETFEPGAPISSEPFVPVSGTR